MKTLLRPRVPLLRQDQRGLSFIELMVALAILGFAMAAMAPDVTVWMRNLAVRNAGEALRAGVERARMEALRRNTNVTFWLVSDSGKVLSNSCALSNTGPSWVVSIASPNGKCAAAPSTTEDPMLIDSWSAADGARGVQVEAMDSNSTATSSVTFNSLGQVLTTGTPLARIAISHSTPGTRSLRVQVDAGGSIRMCDPNVEASDPRKC
ncbi:GspH/FimT family pseudopilin [Paucibacter sp. AS339]|uniref:GspH/FimT family pseudopilin n=1 Tax=Paucibacter hankyongi TaxID=3133434 RepID=UPI0030AEA30E